MRRFALALIFAFLWSAFPLRAQSPSNAPVIISTDRPSVANSSAVVPQSGLQVENGLLLTNTQGQYVLDLPETSFRYGLLNTTELRLAVPDYYHNFSSSPSAASGFGDTALGVKQFLGLLPGGFNLSAIFFLSFPTGAQEISSHGYDPGLQFPWSRPLSQHWTVAGQVAFYWPTLAGTHNFTGETTFFFDRQLTKPWDAFVEYAGDFPERGGSRQFLHFGTAYKLAPHHQIDFHVAVGLSNAAPHAYVGFGYSFLFLSK
ncbi:MAG TPA: transporter [Candidatus Sulfotelmatobacter sp.]|nr:transporter [Candidatus Sulfotelmatobacter sp.]